MRLNEAYEVVLDSIENDIKYCNEINKNFDETFLNDVIDFLATRVDVLNRAEIRERNFNRFRGLEK